jgi:hypothetical protein
MVYGLWFMVYGLWFIVYGWEPVREKVQSSKFKVSCLRGAVRQESSKLKVECLCGKY